MSRRDLVYAAFAGGPARSHGDKGRAAQACPPGTPEDRHRDDARRFYNGGPLAEIVAETARFGFLNHRSDTLATELEARPRAAFDTLETTR